MSKETGDKKLTKLLFTSSLVVSLAAAKIELEHLFIRPDNIILYFFLFLISIFSLASFEFLLEKLDNFDFYKKLFSRRDYIGGWWVNYALDRETNAIYNFALLNIDSDEENIHLDGRTFKACLKENNQIEIFPDGHFFSTIAQYQSDRSLLGFGFTIDDSEKVRSCKYKLFGNAEYFFERGHRIPRSFTGEFYTDNPTVNNPKTYCSVVGHRINEKIIIKNDSLMERYRNVLQNAIEKSALN